MGIREILRELIVDSGIIFAEYEDGQYVCNLPETNSDYSFKLRHLPKDAFAIKCDSFPDTGDVFFRGKNDECKKADYALISESQRVIMFFELARSCGTKTENESIAQLKGATCIMDYCGHIAASFFDSPDIRNFDYRYYIVRYSKSVKRTLEILQKPGGWKPENAKKIGGTFVSFKYLQQ